MNHLSKISEADPYSEMETRILQVARANSRINQLEIMSESQQIDHLKWVCPDINLDALIQ